MVVRGLACSALLAGTFTASVVAAGLPPIPDKPEAAIFKDVPTPWRDYLIKARAAERIADPLQRCLAYPDIPGNKWPDGHAAAHCRLHAAHTFSLEEVEAQLQRNGVSQLERRLDAILAKHFSSSDFGEDIDVAFDAFESSGPSTDRVTALWLKKAPGSAYAHLARAHYYMASAGDARGGEYAAKTPRENFRRMTGLVDQAVPLYEEAIRLQPKLMPAYGGLLNASRLDSRPELERKAVEMAKQQDPACIEIARQRMDALQPRWGGSYEQMLSYAAELSAHVGQRPALAMHMATPYGHRGNRMIADKEMGRETLELLDIAVSAGSLELYLNDAANVLINSDEPGVPDSWKALSYLLQEARFSPREAWTYRNIGRLLIRREPEMGLVHLSRAEKLEPGNAYVQYAMGASLYNAGRYPEAEKHYLAAIKDADQKQASLRELITMWMFDAGLERKVGASRAKPYLDQLLAAYPDDGRGWMYRILHDGAVLGSASDEVVQKFLRVADRKDPRQAEFASRIEAAAKHPVMRSK